MNQSSLKNVLASYLAAVTAIAQTIPYTNVNAGSNYSLFLAYEA